MSAPLRFLPALLARLRADGFAVSPGEAIDAARALEAVGVEDRAAARAALGAALAKTRAARAAFERHFDEIFAAPRRAGREKGKGGGGAAPEGGAAGRAGGEGAGRGFPPSQPSLRSAARGRRAERPTEPARRPGERRQRAEAERRIEALVGEHGARHRAGRRRALRRFARPATPGETDDPRRWDLRGPLDPAAEEALERAFARAVSALRIAVRRRRRAGRRGPIDVHAALRKNLAAGGVPFVLPRRERARRRPRLVVLADVSWSVERAAGFFLAIAGALAARFRETRVFLFVDLPVEATDEVARGEPIAVIPGLRRGARSDYGRALYAFLEKHRGALRRDTLLVVLGDARANRFPEEAWCMEEIAARVRRVVWLVPEPRERWGTGDSALLAYAPHCDLVREAATLEGLIAAAREIAVTGSR